MALSKDECAAFARRSREEIITTAPFIIRRVARWAECDPAGVVYTGNFAEYMLSAVHLFRRHVLQASWQEIKSNQKVDTPAKAIAMVFNGSLWPDDVFDVTVRVGDIRTRTFDFVVSAVRADDGTGVFTGSVSAICVDSADRRVAAPIPAALHDLLEGYRTDTDSHP
ncbi:MAG: 4-hydroxybenzoyl-CoA thioesterase [Hyphomicrobiales bacterium]